MNETVKITAEERREKLEEYLMNTSAEQIRKDIEARKHLQDVDEPINPKLLQKLFKAADDARTRVSGYSRKQRAQLLEKARVIMYGG